jgi:hypothetical protein
MNLEATSGALPARPEWIRQNLPMSDRAIASGLYMRTLSRREAVALMASTVLDYLLAERRFEESIEVAEIILRHYPRDGYTMVKLGSAYGEMMRAEFIERFPNRQAVPPSLQPRYAMLAERNRSAFQAAEALGWEPAS